jgi:hypothetical protein
MAQELQRLVAQFKVESDGAERQRTVLAQGDDNGNGNGKPRPGKVTAVASR